MKFRLAFVGACATGLFLIPLAVHASPGVGTGTCTTATQPTPPSGSKTVPVPGVPPGTAPGTAYAYASTAKVVAGIKGSHGWIQESETPGTKSGNLSGYSNDTGHLNGYGKTSGTTAAICIGFNGKTVHN